MCGGYACERTDLDRTVTVRTVDAKLPCVMSVAKLNRLDLSYRDFSNVLRSVEPHDGKNSADQQ
jgi:hypothetical protein